MRKWIPWLLVGLLLLAAFGATSVTAADKRVKYTRTVDGDGSGMGVVTLSLNGVPLTSHPGQLTFEYVSQATGYCDNTYTEQITFTVTGASIVGQYSETNGNGNGEWVYNGLTFIGPGGPGFQSGLPANGPFLVGALPWVDGELDLGPLGPGVLSLSFVSNSGSAGGIASFSWGSCAGDPGSAVHIITSLDPDVCDVALAFYWQETPAGLAIYTDPNTVPIGIGAMHKAKVYSPCSVFLGRAAFNADVETVTF